MSCVDFTSGVHPNHAPFTLLANMADAVSSDVHRRLLSVEGEPRLTLGGALGERLGRLLTGRVLLALSAVLNRARLLSPREQVRLHRRARWIGYWRCGRLVVAGLNTTLGLVTGSLSNRSLLPPVHHGAPS